MIATLHSTYLLGGSFPVPLSMVSDVSYAVGIVVQHFGLLLIGVLLGMALGVIPGLGGLVALTVLLPFTIRMDPFSAFILLTGALGATTFSGSITAILVNTPGTASNAATIIDGYPLTQKGESTTALTISAIASASGAVFAGIVFVLAVPLMTGIVLLFGPSEIFWIVLFALVVIPLIVSKRSLMGVLTALFGVLLGLIGNSPETAEPRWTFGIFNLRSGISILALAIGFFAIAELVRVASLDRETIIDMDTIELTGSKMKGLTEVIKHRFLLLRASIIGLLIGAIPGAGGAVAGFVAYAHGAQTSDDPNYGEGAYEGVLAPEASNDAKDLGQLFPTLGLGIPGSASMAVFLAAFLVHGIIPSPRLLLDHTELVYVIAISLMTSNILTSVIGLVVASHLTEALKTPFPVVLPVLTALTATAVFLDRSLPLDWAFTIAFAILGIIMIYNRVSRIPLVIGFILSVTLEDQYAMALGFAHGDFVEAFFTGTSNWVLIVIFSISLLYVLLSDIGRSESPEGQ